jgi:hypothetical protein
MHLFNVAGETSDSSLNPSQLGRPLPRGVATSDSSNFSFRRTIAKHRHAPPFLPFQPPSGRIAHGTGGMDHWRTEGGRSRADDADTANFYYPPADMGPFLSSSVEQRVTPKPRRPSCLNRTLPFIGGGYPSFPTHPTRALPYRTSSDRVHVLPVVILVVAIVVVVVCVRGSGSDASTTDASANSSSSSAASASSALPATSSSFSSSGSGSDSCAEVSPSNRTVVFWQTEVAGCDLLPTGVTHVVWGFALVADGAIVPTFQGADATLAACVQSLRAYVYQSPYPPPK